MMNKRFSGWAALLAATTAACGGGPSTGPGSSMTGGSGGASSTTTSTTTTTSTGGSGGASPIDGGVPCTDSPGSMCCAEDKLRPLPTTAASVLDLSSPETLSVGTCATYVNGQSGASAIPLSLSPGDYPMKIILPALSGADPACMGICPDTGGPRTAFGFAIRTGSVDDGHLIGADTGRLLAISVPPPWYFVSGGCGEACAWPCLEGYQEFGVRSCITLAYGDFGFATSDPNAPSVEAVVELIDLEGKPAFEYAPYGCCLFQ